MTITMTSSNTPSITSLTLQFVLTTNQHGLVIEFDTLATGSGTIDAQNTSSFTGSLAGNYVFSYSGLDPNLVPMFGAGAFHGERRQHSGEPDERSHQHARHCGRGFRSRRIYQRRHAQRFLHHGHDLAAEHFR